MSKTESAQIISGLAEFFAKSMRTPILRRPDEYGMAYEDVFFPSLDGVGLEGWFIPADPDRIVIANHFMPGNRYGYPGHLEPWNAFNDFEVTFCPTTKPCMRLVTTCWRMTYAITAAAAPATAALSASAYSSTAM
jgi:hypothetical protein